MDADACPVREEALRVAERHDIEVVFVSNGGIRPIREPRVRVVIVSQGPDAADDWIVERLKPNDIVVTTDVPLAHRAVTLGAAAIAPNGRLSTPDSIGMARAMRDLKQQLREAGVIKGHNPAFSARDRAAFLQALDSLIQRAKRDSQQLAAPRSAQEARETEN